MKIDVCSDFRNPDHIVKILLGVTLEVAGVLGFYDVQGIARLSNYNTDTASFRIG
jgi:hypothetical protein